VNLTHWNYILDGLK